MSSKQSIKWTFKEYEKHERKQGWYLTTAIIGGAILIYAILTHNFLFALIVIMFGIVMVINHHNQPDDIKFEINHDGIKLNRKQYPYKELENFWIIYEPPEVKNLYFHFKTSLKPRLSIPLIDNNPIEIKAFLRQYLEEDLDQDQEPASETLGRLWKL